MHIPDAVLSPGVAAATGVVAAAGLALGLRTLRARASDRTTVLMGMMSAFVFAAQMVNFPVFPGVSGHLLGGVLAAVMLGPWAGAVAIAAVLLVQCFLFGDGGLYALGANFVNMGLIGAVAGYAIYAPIRRAVGGRGGVILGGMVAAWFSVLLASGAFAVELAASGRAGAGGFLRVLGWMALVHAVIGLGEALITGLVLRSVLLARPDLIDDPELRGKPSAAGRWGQVAGAGLAVALAVAIVVAPLASEFPDGLEYLGERLGFLNGGPAPFRAPIDGYELPIPGVRHVAAATAAAGAVGTLVVFAVGLGLARAPALRRRVPEGMAADAA